MVFQKSIANGNSRVHYHDKKWKAIQNISNYWTLNYTYLILLLIIILLILRIIDVINLSDSLSVI